MNRVLENAIMRYQKGTHSSTPLVISLCMLLFLSGLMIGADVQAKNDERRQNIQYCVPLAEEDKRDRILIASDDFNVYLLDITAQTIEIIVENHTQDKVNDVCLDNVFIDGENTVCYADIEGVNAGETKVCSLAFEKALEKEEAAELSGTLLIRGKKLYYSKQLDFHDVSLGRS